MKFHEIFAYGVRNMWRCSVDRGDSESGYGAGRIFCGDVGQNRYEEIDIIVNGGNYGWRAMEGNSCYDSNLCNERFIGDNYVSPIHVYSHSVGKSVTGGYVYRGCQYPHLQGIYIYGDFWNGRLFKLEENGEEWTNTEICLGTKDICTGNLWNFFPKNILSFGEDEAGEVYMLVTDIASSSHTGGKIFRFVDPNKRGNPEECHVEERPVPVFGPISPFEPSSNEKNGATTDGQSVGEEDVTKPDSVLTTSRSNNIHAVPTLCLTLLTASLIVTKPLSSSERLVMFGFVILLQGMQYVQRTAQDYILH
ncbi:HHIP-like protein 2 [Holothuria leucospilota]|uniref:HHIP-like protein 2 n=1 Tax=Holothuria leucospilota TaxID=206669 RepID=A0A9Q1CIK4_HOLLE|nr:HHIP-like protein 2 [Holothuria leucospilota]